MVSSANHSSRSISPSSSQPATMLLDLVGDGGGVAAHELVPQRLVVEHLAAALGRRVEDHALAEDRRHERVGLGLVELLLGRPEEELVGVGPGQQHHVAVGQPELADVAALGPHPLPSARWGRACSSSRWPFSPSPPDTRGGSRRSVRGASWLLPVSSSDRCFRLDLDHARCVPAGRATACRDGQGHAVRAQEGRVAGQAPARPLGRAPRR